MLRRLVLNVTALSGFAVLLCGCGRVQQAEAQKPEIKPSSGLIVQKQVVGYDYEKRMSFVNNQAIYSESWDTLSQPRFWKQIMSLSPDSCIINIASTRTPLQTVCYKNWCSQSEFAKTNQKIDIRSNHCVSGGEELFVTNGKREFYEHRKTIPTINDAVRYFCEYGVDPWYAQTILLIESPGKQSAKSSVGANGPFQLMRSVALKYGLRVNAKVDERSDLKRAAYAASKLISTICVPKVKGMLDSRGIAYNETDIWFRLLVLHAYHAGAGNLNCAMNKLNPTRGGQELITNLWHTEAGGFKNESQNYSQIALAAVMNFEEILRADGDTLFLVSGDRAYSNYKRLNTDNNDKEQEALRLALSKYERDLVDGIIPFNYFVERTQALRFELAVLNGEPRKQEVLPTVYPADDQHYLALGKELLRKRKVDDAIKVLNFNIENYPQSVATADSLSRAYRLGGNLGLARKYMLKTAKGD